MQFRPVHDRVVVRRLNAAENTGGGIVVPDTARESPIQGKIIAVGPGARNKQGEIVGLDVRAGDNIRFGKWSCTEVRLMDLTEGKPVSASPANEEQPAKAA